MPMSIADMTGSVEDDGPIARTALGDLRGIWHDGIAAFRGVPYAAPPVGDLRFAPAAPVRAWSGLLDATHHGPIAPQLPGRLVAVAGHGTPRPQHEDCLTLTICTPATGRASHGQCSCGCMAVPGCSALARPTNTMAPAWRARATSYSSG